MSVDPTEIILDGPLVVIAGVPVRVVSRATVAIPPINVPAVASPTGRDPILLWSPARQAIWAEMLAAKHPWTERVKQLGSAPSSYPDRGEWQVMAYQMTGDPAFAANAWTRITKYIGTLIGGFSRNTVRENMIEEAVFYDWLKPWMSPEQDAQFVAYLHLQCEFCLAIRTSVYSGGFRTTDTDQTTGQYFGIIAVDKVTGSNYASKIPANVEPAIRNYLVQAKGGVWIESSEYNVGTVRLLLMGAAIAGWDVSEFAAEYGRAECLSITPDLADSFQWGDNQAPHQLRLYTSEATLAMVGSTDAVLTLSAKYPAVVDQPWWRWAYFFDPSLQARSDLAAGSLFAEGTGHFRVKTDRALFATHFPSRTGFDHEVPYFGDFQLYLDGEWVIGHPIGYGLPVMAMNTMLLAGFGSMNTRGAIGSTSADGIHTISGTTSGLVYALPYYDPPPVFLRNWTRTLTFIEPSTIVIHDKIDMDDPSALPKADRYRHADQAAMKAGPAQRWLLHTPEPATLLGQTVVWKTPNGKTATLQTLLPTAPAQAVVDETSLYGTACASTEKKWIVQLGSPALTTEWLNVISIGDTPVCSLTAAGVIVDGRLIATE